MQVEKDFIRQLERVDPCTVRPLAVLQRALQRVKQSWQRDEDYDYAWNQVTSLATNDSSRWGKGPNVGLLGLARPICLWV